MIKDVLDYLRFSHPISDGTGLFIAKTIQLELWKIQDIVVTFLRRRSMVSADGKKVPYVFVKDAIIVYAKLVK